MEKIIFNKQTDKQKTSNDRARIQFIMAMMNFDLNMIIPLLNLDNKFLGYMNSWQLCNWFRIKKKIPSRAYQQPFYYCYRGFAC